MEEIKALKQFIENALDKDKARRYLAVLDTKKGKKKITEEFHHQFESHIRNEKVVEGFSEKMMKKKCYIFGGNKGFGLIQDSISQAYELLSSEDSWLIIASDASCGIFRPEDYWDDTKWIKI